MQQPKTFLITQTTSNGSQWSDRNLQLSQKNSTVSLARAAQMGWTVELWPAVDGFALDSTAWDRIGVRLLDRGAIVKRPGARGCFHSHFGLWQHCVDLKEPIVIFEHDAKVVRSWPQTLDLDCCVWKLHTPDGRGERLNEITGHWSCGAWAYTVTPQWAAQLIAFSRTHGAQAVDKQIGSAVVPWQYTDCDIAVHGPSAGISTTSTKATI
jgi:hypothetical protein